MVFSFYLQELLSNENTWDKDKLLKGYNKEEYKGNLLGTKTQPMEPSKDWIEVVLHEGTKLFRAQHLMYHINYIKTQYIKDRLNEYKQMKEEEDPKYMGKSDTELESISYKSYDKWRRSMIMKWVGILLKQHKGFIVINNELAHKIRDWNSVKKELEQNQDREKTLKMCVDIEKQEKEADRVEYRMKRLRDEFKSKTKSLLSSKKAYTETREKLSIDLGYMTDLGEESQSQSLLPSQSESLPPSQVESEIESSQDTAMELLAQKTKKLKTGSITIQKK